MRSKPRFIVTFLITVAVDLWALPNDYYVGRNSINDQQIDFADQAPFEDDSAPEQIEIFKTDRPLGHVSGLAVNAEGNIIAFHRSGRVWNENSFNEDETFNKNTGGPIKNSTIAIIEASSGKIIDEFGSEQFYMPHGLSLDPNGDLWLTDVGSHQVHQIDAKTKKIVRSFGESMVPGSDEKHFCKPTDVAIAKNGHFFVADGYCNSRVLKFDANGKLMDVINAAPAGLEEGGRKVPTGIPITSANDIGRVYAIREKNHYLMGVTGSSEDLEAQMFTIDMQTGKTNTFAKGIENAHALAISADGSVYVSQLEPSRIVKISLL